MASGRAIPRPDPASVTPLPSPIPQFRPDVKAKVSMAAMLQIPQELAHGANTQTKMLGLTRDAFQPQRERRPDETEADFRASVAKTASKVLATGTALADGQVLLNDTEVSGRGGGCP